MKTSQSLALNWPFLGNLSEINLKRLNKFVSELRKYVNDFVMLFFILLSANQMEMVTESLQYFVFKWQLIGIQYTQM